MELRELQAHLVSLANQEEADAPFVNCYLNLESGVVGYRKPLDEAVCLFKKRIPLVCKSQFWEAIGRIEAFVGSGLLPASKGAAIFSRGGQKPFFLPLQFGAPLPSSITLSAQPSIFHLVELMDNFHRYVVLLSSEEAARILEVNVGTITEAAIVRRPDLRQRSGREWNRDHFRRYRSARTVRFVNEQIRCLDQVLTAGGYRHFILAGDPRLTAQVQKALPRSLSALFVAAVHIPGTASADELVTVTLDAFVAREEVESQRMARRLGHELRTGGPAVAGTIASMQALSSGNVRLLIMASTYEPGPGWMCASCGGLKVAPLPPPACQVCNASNFREVLVKEEMTRVAVRNGCQIEIVEDHQAMESFAGVGCLLRYLTPESFRKPAA